MLTLVPKTPFPEVPGADALGVLVAASGRAHLAPLLFLAALEDLERDAGTDARPLAWHKALQDGIQERRDLADAFAKDGLMHSTLDWPDGRVTSRFTLHGKELSLAKASARFWPRFRSAVVAGLDKRQEMAGVARARILAALGARAVESERAIEADLLAYLHRKSWSVPISIYWVSSRDLRYAIESVGSPDLAGIRDWGLVSSIETVISADGAAVDMERSDPFNLLREACAANSGLLIGRTFGSAEFAPIDVRHLEMGALRFEGEDYDRARSGDVAWSNVCIDRELLLRLFPPPVVVVMDAVRGWWSANAIDESVLAATSPNPVAPLSQPDPTATETAKIPAEIPGDEYREILAAARAWVSTKLQTDGVDTRLYWVDLEKDVTQPKYGVGSEARKTVWRRLRNALKDEAKDQGAPTRWNEFGRKPKAAGK